MARKRRVRRSPRSICGRPSIDASEVLAGIRARGAFVLILYKPKGVDRYLEIKNGYAVPQFLRQKFQSQREEIAELLQQGCSDLPAG